MTRSIDLLIVLGIVLSFSAACSQGHLTTADAQNAVDRWKKGWLDSQIKRQESFGVRVTDQALAELEAVAKKLQAARVVGVQEVPSDNTATAELDMSAPPPGYATFVHFTDGRWVMTTVQWKGEQIRDQVNITVR